MTADEAAAPSEVDEVAARDYLAQVLAEIDEEVRRRRLSGDLPARVERELDELFLEHSPVGGRGGGLAEALRMVDAAAFIDPVVPIESQKSGGAVVKKGLRRMSLWYVGYITHQVSQFASAVSRSLHIIDQRVTELRRDVDARRVEAAGIVEVPAAADAGAWWVPDAAAALGRSAGRVLHAAAGDGWLVRTLVGKGVDAYGVDPRPGVVDRAELDGTDLRQEPVVDHLLAVEPAGLVGIVLSGVVDGMTHGERAQLLDLVGTCLAPDGTLVVHSCSPAGWAAEDAPVEADLAPGRPLRAATLAHVLAPFGFDVTVASGPTGGDYLVTAVRRGH